MKKKLHSKRNIGIKCVVRSFFVTLLFLTTAFVANGSSLQQKISIKLKNATIKELLLELNRTHNFGIVFNEKDLPANKRVTISYDGVELSQVLKECLNGTDLNYKIDNGSVIISKNKPATTNQQKKLTIKGRIVGEDLKPITGATILVKGTSIGAISDDKGAFTLSTLSGSELEVSFVGCVPQALTVNDDKQALVVTLKADAMAVEDVVVTGIFERRSGSFTGSATSLKSEDLKRVGNQNVFASLKNIDPSLMIFDNLEFGSDPNKNPEMRLRGTSSFDLSTANADLKGTYGNDPNAPLFILDGFEATVQKIMDLDMNRIESLTILKDASAKAIYGSKAANGVIVIETKKSAGGDLIITYNGSVDVSIPDLSTYNLTNAREKLEVEKNAELFVGDSYSSNMALQQLYNRKYTAVMSGIDTDWLAKPVRAGVGTKHSISIEMGSEKFRVVGDFSYNNTQGVMKGSDRVNYQGAISLSYRYKNLNFSNQLSVSSNIANDSPYGSFNDYAEMNSYYSPYDKNGLLLKNVLVQFEEPKTGDENTNDEDLTAADFVDNPLYNASLNTLLKQQYIDITNNFYIEWTIKEGLKATGRLGVSEKRNSADEYYPGNHLKFRTYTNDNFFRRGSYQKNEGKDKRITGDLNVNYSKPIGAKHYVFANAGLSLSENAYNEDIYYTEGYPNDKMNSIIFAKQFTKDSKPKGSESTIRDIGFLFAANYSYDNRLFVDGSYRISASSQFGANSRWGQFWSAGGGWNIHNEKWLKGTKGVDLIKLRGSVGYTGSQSADAYSAMATYIYNLDRVYDTFLGATLRGMQNKDLKWQDKLDYNIGMDINLFKKLSLKFDYYLAKTNNTLTAFSLPGSTGFESVTENVGSVQNKGFDLKVTYNIWQDPKNRSYFSVNAAISRNKNKITGISNSMKNYNAKQDAIAADNIKNNTPVQKFQEGVSMDAIWAVRSLGIDPATGNEVFINRFGQIVDGWSAADQVVLGDKLPKFQGNAGFSLSYKGIELNAVFTYQYGAQLYNETLLNKVENADLSKNVDRRVSEGRWSKPGDLKPYKKISTRMVKTGDEWQEQQIKTTPTSRFIQDRNDLSLSSLSLGYDFFRHDFIKKIGLERLRANVYMNDVFTISTIEIERGTSYPFARSFNFSLTATF